MSGELAGIRAVIFDWAGTTVDHGSRAPIEALTELFAGQGIAITAEDARREMGMAKRDHIARIAARHGIEGEERVEALYAAYQPLQMKALEKHAEVLAGVAEATERLRAEGIRIGATTGYTRPMVEALLRAAAEQGYRPDLALCPEDAGGGRPAPWMCMKIALAFRVEASAEVVKIGDTPSDIAEGLNAGMWTVGIAATGNEVGLGAEELAALPAAERTRRIAAARRKLLAAGAHAVVDGVAQCEAALADLAARRRRGERP